MKERLLNQKQPFCFVIWINSIIPGVTAKDTIPILNISERNLENGFRKYRLTQDFHARTEMAHWLVEDAPIAIMMHLIPLIVNLTNPSRSK
jgi:hypothetical protein